MPRMTMIVDAHSVTWGPEEDETSDLPDLPPVVKLLLTVDTEVESDDNNRVTAFFDTEGVSIEILDGENWGF